MLQQKRLDTKRKALASLAIRHAKESLTFGAANLSQGITVIPKVHQVLEKYLSFKKPYPDVSQKKLIIMEAIAFLRKETQYLALTPLEEQQIKGVIANYLMHFLFSDKLIRAIENLQDLKEHTAITRVFQTGNCGDQVLLALEYLLENHREEKDLYPIKVLEARKANAKLPRGTDPEDGHQLLLLGRLSEEDPVLGEDISNQPDPVACDPWQGKSFFFIREWQREAPVGLRGNGLDFENSATLFHLDNPTIVKNEWLQLAHSKLNIEVTALEVNEWVSAFFDILTKKPAIDCSPGLPIYRVNHLNVQQIQLIVQHKGRVIDDQHFELAPVYLKSVKNGGIRETLGLQRIALTNMTNEKVMYFQQNAPQVTLEKDPHNDTRYFATYENQHHVVIEGFLEDPSRIESSLNPSLLYLKSLQEMQAKNRTALENKITAKLNMSD
jgi:hypothetical protein